MNREQRRARGAVEVRAAENGAKTIRLRPITPNVVDDYGSVFMPDTFDASLGERMPTLAWGHNWTDPIGRGADWGEDGEHRWIDFRVDDPNVVPSAARALAQVASGTIDDCSVGFSNTKRREPTDEELERWPGAREIIERADLDEVSLVLRGAVPGAKVLSLRSADGAVASVPEELLLDLAEKVSAGELTEAAAKAALRLASDEAPAAPPAATDPPVDTVDDTADVDIDDALATYLDRS